MVVVQLDDSGLAAVGRGEPVDECYPRLPEKNFAHSASNLWHRGDVEVTSGLI
jgi:hypothetical protein